MVLHVFLSYLPPIALASKTWLLPFVLLSSIGINDFFRVVEDTEGILEGCTYAEASRYGRFLSNTLEKVKKWKNNKSTFEKECKETSFVKFKKVSVAWEHTLENVRPDPHPTLPVSDTCQIFGRRHIPVSG